MSTTRATTTTVFLEDKEAKEAEIKEPKLKESKFKLSQKKQVHWSEDTVNNENMGKRKSKICCIYHKPRLNPDDSSSESCDSCDEKGKNAYERPNHYERKKDKGCGSNKCHG